MLCTFSTNWLNFERRRDGSRLLGRLHTHRLFAESNPAPVVEFFTRTGITAAGGQFDFERCTRKVFVHRNRSATCLCSYILGEITPKKTNKKENTEL